MLNAADGIRGMWQKNVEGRTEGGAPLPVLPIAPIPGSIQSLCGPDPVDEP